MSHVCIFCGGPLIGKQRAKEHIYPAWLQRHLGIENHPLLMGQLGQSPERSLSFGKFRAGKVCERCNSGWMSHLETDTRPFLEPLIDDTFNGVLAWQECQLIAAWLFKTALVLNSAAIHRIAIPSKHYQSINNRRAIPAGVRISIARLAPQGDTPFFVKGQRWIVPRDILTAKQYGAVKATSYKITMRFGHLLGRVAYWPLSEIPLFEYLNGIQHVCPVRRDGITWPPNDTVNNVIEFDESLMVMRDPFTRALDYEAKVQG